MSELEKRIVEISKSRDEEDVEATIDHEQLSTIDDLEYVKQKIKTDHHYKKSLVIHDLQQSSNGNQSNGSKGKGSDVSC